jgi:hypothetical protein
VPDEILDTAPGAFIGRHLGAVSTKAFAAWDTTNARWHQLCDARNARLDGGAA